MCLFFSANISIVIYMPTPHCISILLSTLFSLLNSFLIRMPALFSLHASSPQISIMEYLEEVYPQNPLLPKEPLLRAKASGAWTAAFKALAIYDSVFVELPGRTYPHIPNGHLNKINKITTYRARLNKMQKF